MSGSGGNFQRPCQSELVNHVAFAMPALACAIHDSGHSYVPLGQVCLSPSGGRANTPLEGVGNSWNAVGRNSVIPLWGRQASDVSSILLNPTSLSSRFCATCAEARFHTAANAGARLLLRENSYEAD